MFICVLMHQMITGRSPLLHEIYVFFKVVDGSPDVVDNGLTYSAGPDIIEEKILSRIK